MLVLSDFTFNSIEAVTWRGKEEEEEEEKEEEEKDRDKKKSWES